MNLGFSYTMNLLAPILDPNWRSARIQKVRSASSARPPLAIAPPTPDRAAGLMPPQQAVMPPRSQYSPYRPCSHVPEQADGSGCGRKVFYECAEAMANEAGLHGGGAGQPPPASLV